MRTGTWLVHSQTMYCKRNHRRGGGTEQGRNPGDFLEEVGLEPGWAEAMERLVTQVNELNKEK